MNKSSFVCDMILYIIEIFCDKNGTFGKEFRLKKEDV